MKLNILCQNMNPFLCKNDIMKKKIDVLILKIDCLKPTSYDIIKNT